MFFFFFFFFPQTKKDVRVKVIALIPERVRCGRFHRGRLPGQQKDVHHNGPIVGAPNDHKVIKLAQPRARRRLKKWGWAKGQLDDRIFLMGRHAPK